MAGIKGCFVAILWFVGATFVLAGVFHLGAWVIPVCLVLAIIVGIGEASDTRKKWARQRVERIRNEEAIREQVRREMRGEP
jgi:hypothetical protein